MQGSDEPEVSSEPAANSLDSKRYRLPSLRNLMSSENVPGYPQSAARQDASTSDRSSLRMPPGLSTSNYFAAESSRSSSWPSASESIRTGSASTYTQTYPSYDMSSVGPYALPPSVGEPPSMSRSRSRKKEEPRDEGEGDSPDSSSTIPSTTKAVKDSRRAQQNRIAQRNFRERREARVKELERKAQQLDQLLGQDGELQRLQSSLQERDTALTQREQLVGIDPHRQTFYQDRIKELTAELETLRRKTYTDYVPSGAVAGLAERESSSDILLDPNLPVKPDSKQRLQDAHAELARKDARIQALRLALEDLGEENSRLRSKLGIAPRDMTEELET